MITPTRPLATALFVAAGLSIACPGPGHAGKDVYDKFGGPFLDPEKWSGSSVEGTSAAPTAEVVRGIDNGQLRLGLVSYGNATTDTDVVTTRQQLDVKQLGTPGGSGFITSMKVTVTILDAEVQDCAANTGSPPQARAQMNGLLFHSGTGGGPSDLTGSVGFSFHVRKDIAAPTNKIVALLFQCTAANCSSNTVLASHEFATHWSLNTPVVIRATWQSASHSVRFEVNPGAAGAETFDMDYTATSVGTDDTDPPTGDFKTLRVQNIVQNCSGARKRGFIDALFDKVTFKRKP